MERHMVQRNKTALLNLRIDRILKNAAMRAAAADRRSLTSLIELMLTDYCQERGFLPKIPLDQPATAIIGPNVERAGPIFQRAGRREFSRADIAIRYIFERLPPKQAELSRLDLGEKTLNFEEMQEIYERYIKDPLKEDLSEP